MRDLNIKKDSGGVLKVISVIVLGGAALLVAAALVVGFVAWRTLRPPQPTTPLIEGPPRGQPIFGPAGPQPPGPGEPLQSLPPPPAIQDKSPPLRPHKRLDITAIRSFGGHTGPVFAVALSPDERRALSGGNDKTIRLWDLDSGEELATLEGHTDAVRDVAFAPDGKRAVSASQDGTLRLWDVAEKKTIRTFQGHKGAVWCAAWTPDGQQVLSGGADRSLRVWDAETGAQLQEWYGHEGAVLCVSVSSEGAFVLTGSADGGATYWDRRSGRQLSYLSVNKPVFFALFAADSKQALVGGDAATRLCDVSNGEQWPELLPLVAEPRRGAAWMPDGHVFLQGAGKRLEGRFLQARHVSPVKLADPRWNLLGEVEAHGGAITRVRAARDGRLALTAGEDGAVKLWRVAERAEKNDPN